MVRVSSESRVPPPSISAVGDGFAKAAEVFEVLVLNASFAERRGERRLSGPRNPLGRRVVADVRESLDSMLREKLEELFK